MKVKSLLLLLFLLPLPLPSQIYRRVHVTTYKHSFMDRYHHGGQWLADTSLTCAVNSRALQGKTAWLYRSFYKVRVLMNDRLPPADHSILKCGGIHLDCTCRIMQALGWSKEHPFNHIDSLIIIDTD